MRPEAVADLPVRSVQLEAPRRRLTVLVAMVAASTAALVIAEGEDIFGDGVNVAARLEALAEPGGVCCSGTVHDQIRDKLPYLLEDTGEQNVKNIARPVRVYARCAPEPSPACRR